MSDVIVEYQRWKQQGEDLRTKAKQAMESRYRDLLLDAIRIAEEYRTDFGGALKPPPAVTAFRYKASPRKSSKVKPAPKAASRVEPKAAEPKAEQPPAKPNPKVARLQKRLATARTKLEAAKSAGSPTRNLEDKVYEIEDDLRLAMGAQ